MAVDFGLKRVGLALCDPSHKVAVGAGILVGLSGRTLARTIKKQAEDRNIKIILIGIPPDGAREVEEVIAGADNLANSLRKMKFTILRWDEEFSTARALADRKKIGGKSKPSKQWIDEAAAILILQDYLARNNSQSG